MGTLKVWHNHVLVGEHDERCDELPPQPVDLRLSEHLTAHPFHRRHEGRQLIISEAGENTVYGPDEWSAAGVNLVCGYTLAHGPADCERCWPGGG